MSKLLETEILLRRFAFGVRPDLLNRALKMGRAGLTEWLLEARPEGAIWPEDALERLMNADQKEPDLYRVQSAEFTRLIAFDAPLQAQMMLFWHNLFAVSIDKVSYAGPMRDYFALIRRHALGSFADLLNGMCRDQAMIFWLDQHENRAGRPNENLARELMELFTLGIGRYTEDDVKEAARALTGWTFGRMQNRRMTPHSIPRTDTAFFIHEPSRDTAPKRVLGQTIHTGQDLIDLLLSRPDCSEWIAEKAWRWFAEDAAPAPAIKRRLGEEMRRNGMQIKPMLRLMMTMPEFFRAAEKPKVKSPIQLCRQLAEATGADIVQQRILVEAAPRSGTRSINLSVNFLQSCRAMGMELMRPPDVAGWPGGRDWISTSHMVERIRLASLWRNRTVGAELQKAPDLLEAWPLNAKPLAEFLIGLTGLRPTEGRLLAVERAIVQRRPRGDVPAGNVVRIAAEGLQVLLADPELQVH
jgi:uncharacterized protein (DUF1800 family)